MKVHFSKYQGTGNDFVMVDGRELDTSVFDTPLVRQICDRRFGIGADGLIILGSARGMDFSMKYFNADGKEGTMCGNGGRCITLFARDLGLIGLEATFRGIDGKHTASILPNEEVRLRLKDVASIVWVEDGYLLDTGSPHFVKFVDDLENIDVVTRGREIRHQSRFGKYGVNVNFVAARRDSHLISVRTYERGVENETLSCGTGVTASAICTYYHFKTDIFSYHVHTPGGNLNVSFKADHHHTFTDIYLTGQVSLVFNGTMEITP